MTGEPPVGFRLDVHIKTSQVRVIGSRLYDVSLVIKINDPARGDLVMEDDNAIIGVELPEVFRRVKARLTEVMNAMSMDVPSDALEKFPN